MTKYKSASGRLMTRLSGSVSLAALTLGFAGPALAVPPAPSSEVTYELGSAPVVGSAVETGAVFQQQTGDVEAAISNGEVTSEIQPSDSSVSATTDLNTVRASAIGNNSVASSDTAIATGGAGESNSVLASALETSNAAMFAGVEATSIRSNLMTPADGSSVSLSGNTLAADATLSFASNALSGDINLDFANGDEVFHAASSTGAASSAGVLLQSSQINTSVENAEGTFVPGFAVVGANSDISLTIKKEEENETLSGLGIAVSENRLSSDFSGNIAGNTLSLSNGGLTTLESAAGLLNLQVNDGVSTPGATEARIQTDSGIAVTIEPGLALEGSNLDFTTNGIAAEANLSNATNRLAIADGISVTTVEVFLQSDQIANDSDATAWTGGSDGMRLKAHSLEGSAITASDNEITAEANAQSAGSVLSIAGATELSSRVEGTSRQVFGATTSENEQDTTPTVSAEVRSPAILANIANSTGETVSGSSVRLDDNAVRADAAGNTQTLAVALSGTSVTDGQPLSTQTAPGLSVQVGTDGLEPLVNAGLSASNVQSFGAEALEADASVLATIADNVGDTIALTVGSGAAVSDSQLSLDGNTVAAAGSLNNGQTTLGVSANTLDASLGVSNLQQAGAGVDVTVSKGDLVLAVNAGSADAGKLQVSADGNTIAGDASGNSSLSTLTLEATKGVVTGADAFELRSDDRTLVASGNNGLRPSTSAEISLVNVQEAKTSSPGGEANEISATLSDGNVINTLGAGDLSDASLSVNANTMRASAAANTGSNRISGEISSLDLAGAGLETGSAEEVAAGTNLVALASTQTNSLDVRSTLDTSGPGVDHFRAAITGNGDRTNVAVSADGNQRLASASGDAVTNTIALGGTNVETPEANAPGAHAAFASEGQDFGLTLENAAVGLANVQANDGRIMASISTWELPASASISASIGSEPGETISDSVVSVNGNRVLARADGVSATNAASLEATNISTSALAASIQSNSALVSATVGSSDSEIAFLADLGDGTQRNDTLSVSRNLAGAVANAISDQSRLSLGGADTASLTSSGTVSSSEASATQYGASGSLDADYGVVVSQTLDVAGTNGVYAAAESLRLSASAGDFIGGTINADQNLLTAQATGMAADTTLDLAATDLGADGNSPVGAAMTGQVFGAESTAQLMDPEIRVSVGSLNAADAGESVSIDANTMLARSIGATSQTMLNATAQAGAGGFTPAQGGTSEAWLVQTNADRILVSTQAADEASVIAIAGDEDPNTQNIALLSGGVAGDRLSVQANILSAEALGLETANALVNTAGSELGASASLTSAQDGDVDTYAALRGMDVTVQAGSDVAASSVDVSGNSLNADATNLTASNTLTTSAGTFDGDVFPGQSVGSLWALVQGDTVLTSAQSVTGDAFAYQTGNTSLLADLQGDVDASAVKVEENTITNSALLASAANTLNQSAGTSQGSHPAALLTSTQSSLGADATSEITGAQAVLSVLEDVTGSSLSLERNAIDASAQGLVARNTLTVTSGTSLAGIVGGLQTEGTDNADAYNSVSLANNQKVNGGEISTRVQPGDDSLGFRLDVSGELNAGAASNSSNMIRAVSDGALATNTVAASANSLGTGAAGLINQQTVLADVTATVTEPNIQVTADELSGSSVMDLSSNLIAAAATAASATNRLTMTADSTVVGYVPEGAENAIGLDGTATIGAMEGLVNAQLSNGTVTTRLDAAGDIGLGVAGNVAGAIDGAAGVENNMLVSQARGNVASNDVALSSGASIDANRQAVIASSQVRQFGAINAVIDGGTSGGLVGITSDGTVSGSVNVDGNLVRASGAANTVLNTLDMVAGSGVGDSRAYKTDGGAISTGAQFAVLNAQTNNSAVTTGISNFNVSLTNGIYGATGSASLTGNTVMADATGNSAYNIVTLNSAGMSYGSASLVNNQQNSADISANISGVSMNLDMGNAGDGGTASFRNNGNTISANAVGNTSTSIINR